MTILKMGLLIKNVLAPRLNHQFFDLAIIPNAPAVANSATQLLHNFKSYLYIFYVDIFGLRIFLAVLLLSLTSS